MVTLNDYKKGMFYKDKRAKIIQEAGINGVKFAGNFEKINSFYCEKAVAKFEEIFFISSNHTGMISRDDALNKKIKDKLSMIVMDGLSYRRKGINGQLDMSITKTIGDGERITMLNESEPVVIVGGYPNYGHFMFEFLPKIIEGLKLFGNKYDFVINASVVKWIDLVNIISKGMIGEYPRFRIVPNDSCIKANNFITIESTRGDGLDIYSSKVNLKLIQKMSSAGLEKCKDNTPIKIYIRRPKNVRWRKIVNADDVRSFWEKRGYLIVEMGRLTQRKQIQILRRCTHIVVEAGADSMAPSLCPPGCKVIELIPEGMVAGFGSASSQYALGHDYKRIYGKLNGQNAGNHLIDHDYMVDMKTLRELD